MASLHSPSNDAPAPFELEDELLSYESSDSNVEGGAGTDHAVRTASIFTRDALDALGDGVFPQRALYASVLEQHASGFPVHVPRSKAKAYINTNAPFSGLICGVQGSGKSHSTATLLESCLISDPRIGTLPAPLSGLVFHFDSAAAGNALQPSEAAYAAALDSSRSGFAQAPDVVILVLPNQITQMRQVYAGLPNVRVAPLHFAPEDISGERLLAMMKVDTDSQMPLYMEVIMDILRSMEIFNYHDFRKQLQEQARSFAPNQKAMMSLRLSLLDSCLKDGSVANRVASHFRQGQLTIIDLSSPFMDASSACSFFEIILGLFIEARTGSPAKLVVLDEAHKYLSDNGSSSRLTDTLLSVIRQQRHLNMRCIISTQEPTVVPSKFLDLCSFIIAHRFSSPSWMKHLAQHVAAADTMLDGLSSKVVALRTGEALLFAPTALSVREEPLSTAWLEATPARARVAPLGRGYLVVRSRLRITRDGGQSLLAVRDEASTTRIAPVAPVVVSPWSVPPDPTLATPAASAAAVLPIVAGAPAAAAAAAPVTPVATPARTTPAVPAVPVVPVVQRAAAVASQDAHTRAQSAQSTSSAATLVHAVPTLPAHFDTVMSVLREHKARGVYRLSLNDLGQLRGKAMETKPRRAWPEDRMKNLAQAAQDAGLVRCGRSKKGSIEWVELAVA